MIDRLVSWFKNLPPPPTFVGDTYTPRRNALAKRTLLLLLAIGISFGISSFGSSLIKAWIVANTQTFWGTAGLLAMIVVGLLVVILVMFILRMLTFQVVMVMAGIVILAGVIAFVGFAISWLFDIVITTGKVANDAIESNRKAIGDFFFQMMMSAVVGVILSIISSIAMLSNPRKYYQSSPPGFFWIFIFFWGIGILATTASSNHSNNRTEEMTQRVIERQQAEQDQREQIEAKLQRFYSGQWSRKKTAKEISLIFPVIHDRPRINGVVDAILWYHTLPDPGCRARDRIQEFFDKNSMNDKAEFIQSVHERVQAKTEILKHNCRLKNG